MGLQRTISDEEYADFSELELGEIPHQALRYAEVTVTPAELLALFTTPKELVPAPGAGKVHELISAVLILDYVSAAYATYGDLTVTNATGTALSNTILLANLLAATADKMVQVMPLVTADAGVVVLENEAIQLRCATGNPITGNSPVRVKVAYRTHETGL